MKYPFVISILLACFINKGILHAQVHYLPDDFPTINSALDAASPHDTIVLKEGIYEETVIITFPVTIASEFIESEEISVVEKTIIDGLTNSVFTVEVASGEPINLIGLTIRNGEDGIMASSPVNLFNNIIKECKDGIDYETGGGGIIRNNLFHSNLDDAIDLDGTLSEVIIEDNIIRDNEDDGIEIRLHDYEGDSTFCRISRNLIYRNGEDGIQFIDYPSITNRTYLLERNLIYDNAMAGIACMDNGDTKEDYRAADIPELIVLVNNTISGHVVGISGGGSMIVLNCIVENSDVAGVKMVEGNSIIANCILHDNGTDTVQSNTDEETLLFQDPMLDESYMPLEESPCVDNGMRQFTHNEVYVYVDVSLIAGEAPDIGAIEYRYQETFSRQFDMNEMLVAPNPCESYIMIRNIFSDEDYTIELLDNTGKVIQSMNSGEVNQIIPMNQYPTGLYYIRRQSGARSIVTSVIKG